MAKRAPLPVVYCPRCRGNHPEGEHKAPAARVRPAGATAGPKAPAGTLQKNFVVKPDIVAKNVGDFSPKERFKKISGMARRKVKEAVIAAAPTVAQAFADKIFDEPQNSGDGVALLSTAHPIHRGKKLPRDVSKTSVETIPAPAAVVAEIERLGQKEIKKRKAAKKKRNKKEVQAFVEADLARKRALKNARQQRWREKQKAKA